LRGVVQFLLAACVLASMASGALCGTIALWDFNDQNFVADIGSGTAVLLGTSSNWETDPTKLDPQDPSGASVEISGWPAQTAPSGTHGIRFNASTVGRSTVKIRWDMRHNIKNGESCPNTVTFQYSTNGGSTWSDGPTWTGFGDLWYLNREVDLTGVPGVANNPNFAFRLVAAWQPGAGKYMPCVGSAYGTTRKWRMDMVRIHDDPAPSIPTTIALWDFNDRRDLVADYGAETSVAQLIGGIALDGDGYQDDFPHDWEPYDSSASGDPTLKGKCLDTTAYPAQGAGSNTAGLQFDVSTVGYFGIKISFDVKHKMDSSRCIRVQYTTDRNANPVTWVSASPLFQHDILDLTQTAWWFNSNIVDLSSEPGVSNNPNFAFRIVTEFDPLMPGLYAASRSDRTYDLDPYNNKHRFDMVRVTSSTPQSAPAAVTIPEAKMLPERQRVAINNAIVCAVHPDYFWVWTDDRSCGIKVFAPQHNLNPGWRVNVTGLTREGRDTEKYIYADSVSRSGYDVQEVKPLGMTARSVGGGDWHYNPVTRAGQIGVPSGRGLNNVGLLVKVCGRVTAYVEEDDDPGYYQFMYVDDGSGLYDGNLMGPGGTPANGIRVVLPKNFSGDYLGKYVAVEGVSSIDRLGGITDEVTRCIRRASVTVIDEP
jgi:hypothetical protein